MSVEPFSSTLQKKGLELARSRTSTLQINVGRLCNQTCRHCHLEAGPDCTDVMSQDTADQVVAFARRGAFQIADITGGAPEMNPSLDNLIARLASCVPTVMLRSNLTALSVPQRGSLMELCRFHRVVIVASLPASNLTQTEAMRGKGVWDRSIATLRELNSVGYGCPGTNLELHLVSNPVGAYFPPPQSQVERKFRRDLSRKYGISFNNLYTFANAPLGRFRRWLMDSGNYESYMQRLFAGFNPDTLPGLMCRTLLSVSWEGFLYDCDFNLACGLFMSGRKTHVCEMQGPPAPGTPITVSDHCYACTAASGFT